MKTLSEILDSFVEALRKSGRFTNIKFVHGGKARRAETPVMSEILACSVGKVSAEGVSGSVCWEPQLEFVLYAPLEQGIRDVSATAHEIALCIWESDHEDMVDSMSISKADYSGDLSAFVQTVTVKLKVSSAADSDTDTGVSAYGFKVYVNANELSGAEKFTAERGSVTHKVGEFLAGEDSEVLLGGNYIINMSVLGMGFEEIRHRDFVVTVTCGDTGESYMGCNVTEVKRKYSKDTKGVVTEYVMTSKGMVDGG